jgi:hypothetical protein
VRLVWGLGTRAVDRVGNDYPRLIALSHPLLRPSNEPKAIRRYSQQFVDAIDLEANAFVTLPVKDVLHSHYPPLRYLVQVDEDGYFTSLRSTLLPAGKHNLVLTFDEMLKRTSFAQEMALILKILENSYHAPVDMEFTVEIKGLQTGKPDVCITILQCRPQSHIKETEQTPFPVDLKSDEVIFSSHFVVPQGYIEQVDYVVFVPPEGYFAIPTLSLRKQLARTIGRLNAALAKQDFICVGPGRWGTSNSDLGVPIDYGDIYNSRSLVELAGQGVGPEPEPSLGTHFFQDLMESKIYPLAIQLDDKRSVFNRDFFYDAPNSLSKLIEVEPWLNDCLRLIKVSDYRPGCFLRVVMNDEQNQAIAFLVEG